MRRDSPSDSALFPIPLDPPPAHAAHIQTHVRLHRVGDPRDDEGGAAARRHQPRPGLPRFRSAGRAHPGGKGRDGRRTPPVRHNLGGSRAAGGACREASALHRPSGRRGNRACGHLRRHRGDDGGHDDRLRPRRQGRPVLALLRELLGRRDSLRRRAGPRAPSSARLPVRPGRSCAAPSPAASRHSSFAIPRIPAAACSPARSSR